MGGRPLLDRGGPPPEGHAIAAIRGWQHPGLAMPGDRSPVPPETYDELPGLQAFRERTGPGCRVLVKPTRGHVGDHCNLGQRLTRHPSLAGFDHLPLCRPLPPLWPPVQSESDDLGQNPGKIGDGVITDMAGARSCSGSDIAEVRDDELLGGLSQHGTNPTMWDSEVGRQVHDAGVAAEPTQ